jgi:CRP-like cAMP-binding protein
MGSIDELSKVELFEGLSPEQLTRISEACEIANFSKGEQLFREGEQAKNLFILLEGKIVIQIQVSSRPANIGVAVINQPYQSLGWSGIVSPYFYTASALCEQDCRLLSVDGAGFVEILNQDSEAGVLVYMRIAEVISNRLRNSRSVLLKAL